MIGKSLNFIRSSCDNEEFVVKHSAGVHRTTGLTYSDQVAFDELIRATLLGMLFEGYNIMDHFVALKKYLLLGQGDMIQTLMDKLGYATFSRCFFFAMLSLFALVYRVCGLSIFLL